MAVDYNNTVLHVGANIAYEEGENKEESRTDYNDKVDQRLAELEARVAALENKNN